LPNPTGTFTVAGNLTPGPSLGTSPIPFQIVTSSTSIVQGVVTVTATASGAPNVPYTYYCIVTYTKTGAESLTSQEFIINCPANLLPIVAVSATGEPSGATNWALYAGIYPNGEVLQQATRTTTATGSSYTFANPLTNNVGANQAVSNVNANILGIALSDSAAVYALGVGGSSAAGGYNQTLGIWANPPALGSSPEALYGYVASLANNAPFEISLKQAWYPALIGNAIGLTLDATTGWFIADTGATGVGNITEKTTGAGLFGVVDDVGGATEAGARVYCILTSGTI